jgi:replicative DNA helicase
MQRLSDALDEGYRAGRLVNWTVPTGFQDLDRIGAPHFGELIVISGASFAGKTALALAIIAHVASRGTRVALFAPASNKMALQQRLVALQLERPIADIERAWSRPDTAMRRAYQSLLTWPLMIEDRLQVVEEMARRVIELDSAAGIDMVIIDNLALLESEELPDSDALLGAGIDPRDERLSLVSRRMAQLAREIDAPLLAIAPLRVGAQHGPQRKPEMTDLYGEGSLEDHAGAVWMLRRESFTSSHMDLHVVKNRYGPLAIIPFRFNTATGQLTFQRPGKTPRRAMP